MAILLSAPTIGSLKVQNTSASPMTMYICNLKTVTVTGDFSSNNVQVLNANGQPLLQIPVNKITNIGSSGANFGNVFSMDNAIAAVSSLIITT